MKRKIKRKKKGGQNIKDAICSSSFSIWEIKGMKNSKLGCEVVNGSLKVELVLEAIFGAKIPILCSLAL